MRALLRPPRRLRQKRLLGFDEACVQRPDRIVGAVARDHPGDSK
jgi:hypothetical protein